MTTAIVVGMRQEAAIVGAPDNAIVIVGAGNAVRLAADVAAAIAAGCDHVLSFGTCGALDPALAAGQVVVACMVGDPPELAVTCDEAWTGRLWRLARAKMVVATYAPATIAAAADKAKLRLRAQADVVDCESWIAGQVARAHGVPFAMLRAISDVARQSLTAPAVGVALDAAGGVDALAVAGSVLRDPAQLPELRRLGDSSALAFDALARALADIGVDFGAP